MGGVEERVRYIGIDTPERDQRCFAEATRANERLLDDGPLRLEYDVDRRDRFGRLLAYVYGADGRMANEEMARTGYAVPLVYRPHGRHLARVERAAAEAAAARRGLHATGGFTCEPREHRRKKC